MSAGALSSCPWSTNIKAKGKADWLIDTKCYHVVSTNQSVLRTESTLVVFKSAPV